MSRKKTDPLSALKALEQMLESHPETRARNRILHRIRQLQFDIPDRIRIEGNKTTKVGAK
jgi:hypothetical protein